MPTKQPARPTINLNFSLCSAQQADIIQINDIIAVVVINV